MFRWSGGRRQEQEGLWYRPYWGFCGKDKAGQCEQFRITSFWAIEVVPSCLTPGLGVINSEEHCLLGCTGQSIWD